MKEIFRLVSFLSIMAMIFAQGTAQDLEVIQLIAPGAENRGFGWSITSGDFNGDVLSDVVVSNPYYDGVNFNTGEVYVYYGNKEFSTEPSQILIDPDGNTVDEFGFYVASAGDVNNDGFDELLVAMNWGVNKVYLYMGSKQGLSDTPDMIITPPIGYSEYGFGHEISNAGDVNGDGYFDILIAGVECYVCIYHGSPSGLNAEPNLVYSFPSGYPSFIPVSTVGDYNNDGYDDIAASVRQISLSFLNIYIFRGSSSGVIPDPQIISIPTAGSRGSVAPAGDINRDGHDDLMVGDSVAEGDYLYEGKVYIFYGSLAEF